MSIFDSIRSQLVPITPEGYPFIGAFALASLVLFWLWTPLGWLGTVLTALVRLFLPRSAAGDAGARGPRGGAGRRPRQPDHHARRRRTSSASATTPLPRISIFMSVFDCHVNRSPVAGRIEQIVYQPGKFLNADLDKASEDNERNSLVIAAAGARIAVVQIAGLVARRIVCFVREGQPVGAGERFGMIRFGSRLDVYLPDGAPPLVAVGQTAIAGETVLADLRAATPGAHFASRLNR